MAFALYPAIDMKDGRCVRLLQGRADAVTDYGDPVEAALLWKQGGADWLHMVDLDGAFTGEAANLAAVARVVRETGLKVQLGGGIRSLDDIAHRLEEIGVARVIVGTLAVTHPGDAEEAARRWPGRVALGCDGKDGWVAIRGWVEDSGIRIVDLALRMRDAGYETVVFTDIARDGMLGAPNIEASHALARDTGMRIIGSGGVSRLDDLVALRDAGCSGAIIGKALYSGAFALPEAIDAVNRPHEA